jgi:hypothetical protein
LVIDWLHLTPSLATCQLNHEMKSEYVIFIFNKVYQDILQNHKAIYTRNVYSWTELSRTRDLRSHIFRQCACVKKKYRAFFLWIIYIFNKGHTVSLFNLSLFTSFGVNHFHSTYCIEQDISIYYVNVCA